MFKQAYRGLVLIVCFAAGLTNNCFAEIDVNGLRGVQIHSENIVTVWLGRESIMDIQKLEEPSNYSIVSSDDPDYSKAVTPVEGRPFYASSCKTIL